jgi:hypothetical protein
MGGESMRDGCSEHEQDDGLGLLTAIIPCPDGWINSGGEKSYLRYSNSAIHTAGPRSYFFQLAIENTEVTERKT